MEMDRMYKTTETKIFQMDSICSQDNVAARCKNFNVMRRIEVEYTLPWFYYILLKWVHIILAAILIRLSTLSKMVDKEYKCDFHIRAF